MLDIKANDVRLKPGAARIAVANIKGDISYLAIDLKKCWQSTWVSWGKATDRAVIQIGDEHYQISIERITS
jgi:hypothetical protein